MNEEKNTVKRVRGSDQRSQEVCEQHSRVTLSSLLKEKHLNARPEMEYFFLSLYNFNVNNQKAPTESEK